MKRGSLIAQQAAGAISEKRHHAQHASIRIVEAKRLAALPEFRGSIATWHEIRDGLDHVLA
jgi:hypothetical protein